MEDNKKLFAHFTGTKDDFEKTPYPVQYEDSVVFIDGDNNVNLNCIYTHGEYYGEKIFTQTEDNGVELQSKYHFNRISIGENDCSTLSFAQGENAKSVGYASYVHGRNSTASGGYSRAYGYETSSNGNGSIAEGQSTVADGDCSHAEGFMTKTEGMFAHAEGISTTASGRYSHAEGGGTTATGEHSHAEGNRNVAYGNCSHAEGYSTESHSNGSHAEGYETITHGEYSHAEGNSTITHGSCSHAEGNSTITHGNFSHAEGVMTEAHGNGSRVSGKNSITHGDYSFAHGEYLTTSNENEVAFGKYNVSDENTFFTIGGGDEDNRKNILQISKNEGFYHTELNGTFNVAGRKMTHNGIHVLKSPIFVLYWDLIALGKSGQLIPGQQYLIMDYSTIPAAYNTNYKEIMIYRSTEKTYKILVTATSQYSLDHNAILLVNAPYYTTSSIGNFDNETETASDNTSEQHFGGYEQMYIKYITHLDPNYSEYYTMCNFDIHTPKIQDTYVGVYHGFGIYENGGVFIFDNDYYVNTNTVTDIIYKYGDNVGGVVENETYLGVSITNPDKTVAWANGGRDGVPVACTCALINGIYQQTGSTWRRLSSMYDDTKHRTFYFGYNLSKNKMFSETKNINYIPDDILDEIYLKVPDIISKRQKGVIYEMRSPYAHTVLPYDFLSIHYYFYGYSLGESHYNEYESAIISPSPTTKNLNVGPYYRDIYPYTDATNSPVTVILPAFGDYTLCGCNVQIVNSGFIKFPITVRNITIMNEEFKYVSASTYNKQN